MDLREDFPKDFLFGVSTSAYQIEGQKFGDCGQSIWDQFAKEGGTFQKQDGAIACDHYHKFEGDLDLIRDGAFDAYRFSFSWARLFPDGKTLNEDAVGFYHRILDGLFERGLKAFATAYHWDMPLALGELGGWTSRDNAQRFGDYMGYLNREFGSKLETMASINEPWCVSWLSYFLGHHAPGVRDIGQAAQAMHYILLAHGFGVEATRAENELPLGIVLNFEPGLSVDDKAENEAATARHNAIYNEWFLQAVINGQYPAAALEGLEVHLPSGWQDDMARISAPLDFLGINNYTRQIVKASKGDWPGYEYVDGGQAKTDMGWEIVPESIGELLDNIHEVTGDLPLYITENGMASAIEFDDVDRINYYMDYLEVVASRASRMPLKGYFAWSLLDNFEWAFGYEKRFGIIHVDYTTLEREPKESYRKWQNWLS